MSSSPWRSDFRIFKSGPVSKHYEKKKIGKFGKYLLEMIEKVMSVLIVEGLEEFIKQRKYYLIQYEIINGKKTIIL